jgi:hypothetical protein
MGEIAIKPNPLTQAVRIALWEGAMLTRLKREVLDGRL